MGIPEGEERKNETEKKYLHNNGWEFSKSNDKHQNTDPGSSPETKDKRSRPRHIIFKLRKVKDKEETLKEARGGEDTLSIKEQG